MFHCTASTTVSNCSVSISPSFIPKKDVDRPAACLTGSWKKKIRQDCCLSDFLCLRVIFVPLTMTAGILWHGIILINRQYFTLLPHVLCISQQDTRVLDFFLVLSGLLCIYYIASLTSLSYYDQIQHYSVVIKKLSYIDGKLRNSQEVDYLILNVAWQSQVSMHKCDTKIYHKEASSEIDSFVRKQCRIILKVVMHNQTMACRECFDICQVYRFLFQ